jgi:hypothetical protein
MPQRIAFGATLLLPETVGDFTDPTRGVLFVFNESGALDLREAFGIFFRHKSQDGFMTVDTHNDRTNGYPSRIIPRCNFNAEGHQSARLLRLLLLVGHRSSGSERARSRSGWGRNKGNYDSRWLRFAYRVPVRGPSLDTIKRRKDLSERPLDEVEATRYVRRAVAIGLRHWRRLLIRERRVALDLERRSLKRINHAVHHIRVEIGLFSVIPHSQAHRGNAQRADGAGEAKQGTPDSITPLD